MATIHQIEANRLNAQKSTGPRTTTGKAASSMNALKSGIDAKSLVIEGEKANDLEALTGEYLDRFQPATPEERVFVDTLIRDDWQLRRLAKVDAQIWDDKIANFFDEDQEAPLGHAFILADRHFERLQRRINATSRSYKSALHELQLVQSARLAQAVAQPVPPPGPQPVENKPLASQIGFVPPPAPQPASKPPIPTGSGLSSRPCPAPVPPVTIP